MSNKLTKVQYAELDRKFKAAKDAWQAFHYLVFSANILNSDILSKRHMEIEDNMDYLGLYVAEYKP